MKKQNMKEAYREGSGKQQRDEIHAQKEGNGRRRDKNERKKGMKAKNSCEE